jgi:hypothetical protein
LAVETEAASREDFMVVHDGSVEKPTQPCKELQKSLNPGIIKKSMKMITEIW